MIEQLTVGSRWISMPLANIHTITEFQYRRARTSCDDGNEYLISLHVPLNSFLPFVSRDIYKMWNDLQEQ